MERGQVECSVSGNSRGPFTQTGTDLEIERHPLPKGLLLLLRVSQHALEDRLRPLYEGMWDRV